MLNIKDLDLCCENNLDYLKLGISPIVLNAYYNSKIANCRYIDFGISGAPVFEKDIPEIVATLRKYKINFITLSSSYSSYLNLVNIFAQFGYTPKALDYLPNGVPTLLLQYGTKGNI